jgi:hypothetical protein
MVPWSLTHYSLLPLAHFATYPPLAYYRLEGVKKEGIS